MDDEVLMRGRVYGADHDSPDPGPQPGHDYRMLVAGPLDGLWLDVTGWSARELAGGAALVTEIGAFGAGGRACYGPGPQDPQRWYWQGEDTYRRPGGRARTQPGRPVPCPRGSRRRCLGHPPSKPPHPMTTGGNGWPDALAAARLAPCG